MNRYEKLIKVCEDKGIIVDDMADLEPDIKGFYSNEFGLDTIVLNKNIETDTERFEILSEELSHQCITVGDITDRSDIENNRQELKARRHSMDKSIGLEDIIEAKKQGIRNLYELAEVLGHTEKFIRKTLIYFQSIYGCNHIGHSKDGEPYIITFEPLKIYSFYKIKEGHVNDMSYRDW